MIGICFHKQVENIPQKQQLSSNISGVIYIGERIRYQRIKDIGLGEVSGGKNRCQANSAPFPPPFLIEDPPLPPPFLKGDREGLGQKNNLP
jgi:hypothetical protein